MSALEEAGDRVRLNLALLQASDGKSYSLSKLKGRAVVLAWFPKAFTAG